MKKLPFLGLIAMTLFCNSCSRDIAYDSDYTKNQFEQNFISTFGEIDPLQDWKTIQNNKVTVAANFGGNEEYTVGIYQDDPLFNASKCGLLAMGKVTDGSSTSLTFDGAIAQSRYYAALFDSKGRSVATTFLASDEKVNFGGTATSAAKAMTRTTVNNVSTNSSDYIMSDATLNAPAFDDSTYYDISTMDAADYTQIDVKLWNPEHFKYGDGLHYYIPAGKTIKANVNFINTTIGTSVIYVYGTLEVSDGYKLTNGRQLVIAKGGKLIVDGTAEFNSGARFINYGTIESTNGVINIANYSETNSDFYNSGTVTMANGGLSVAGNFSKLYNIGTVSTKYINVGGTFTFTNLGTMVVGSTTKDNYTTDGQGNGASNFILINGCHATINAMGIHKLILCDNSRIDCPTGIYTGGGNGGELYLGNYSEVNAGDWHDNGGKFYGPETTNDFSIFKFTGKLTMDKDFASKGLIYYDGDFSTNVIGYSSNTVYWIEENVKKGLQTSTEATSKWTIPAGTCTGTGYNPNGAGGDVPTAAPAYTIVFEDLGTTDDFDFNDIVLFVYPYTKSNKLKVVLVANGGTLKTDVKFGDTDLFTATGTMTNTTLPLDKAKVIAEKTIDLPNGFTISKDNYASQFKIVVNGTTSIEATTEEDKGKAPQVLIIPGEWSWPTERQNIGAAYPRFKNWVTDKTKDTDWYK